MIESPVFQLKPRFLLLPPPLFSAFFAMSSRVDQEQLYDRIQTGQYLSSDRDTGLCVASALIFAAFVQEACHRLHFPVKAAE